MPGVRPVRELTNAPAPVPSLVRLFAVVGLGDVLQQTPRAVTEAVPSAVTFPPPVAVVCAMAVMGSTVVTVGGVPETEAVPERTTF